MLNLTVKNGMYRNNSGTFSLVLPLEYQLVNAKARLFQAKDNKIEHSKRVFPHFTQPHCTFSHHISGEPPTIQ